jgi:NAD(P)-dependent dehydrogenase (short-subunit alcohol dehydrogenase family)
MAEVEGKVAFITGGSSGIGLGIARAFLNAGMKVAISYKTDQHFRQAWSDLGGAADRFHAVRLDVTDRLAMERAAVEITARFKRVHVLVNNAGVTHLSPLGTASYDDWDWVMNVNLNGVFNGIHTFLPRIRAQGDGGHIVTIASIGGIALGGSSYGVSKFAVVGLTEGLRAELSGENIGVSVCCPAHVDSDISDAKRNRPPNLGNTGADDAEAQNWARGILRNPELSMEPSDVGRIVLRGIRNNDLYIFTHPDFEPIIRLRNRLLTDSVPKRPFTQAHALYWQRIAKHSIYATELKRRRKKIR